MRKLVLMLALLLLGGTAGFAQNADNDPPRLKVAIAGVDSDKVSIQAVLANPVVSISNSRSSVAAFDIAWVVSGREPIYMGPYSVTGNKVNGVALQQLEADVKNGKVTRMFVDNVSLAGANGTVKKTKAGMAYKVLP
jgi:hypothetical protein